MAAYSIALLAAGIAALWIAAKIVLRNVPKPMLVSHSFAMIIWLVLGGLFVIPLTDFVTQFYLIFSVFVHPFSTTTATLNTIWGSASWSLYAGSRIFLPLLIYSIVLLVASKPIHTRWSTISEFVRLSPAEGWLILLVFGGLVNLILEGILLGIVLPSASHFPVQLGMGCRVSLPVGLRPWLDGARRNQVSEGFGTAERDVA